jgi:hypothetical protein
MMRESPDSMRSSSGDVKIGHQIRPSKRNVNLQINEKAPPDFSTRRRFRNIPLERHDCKSADFYIGEFTRDIRRHISPADHDSWREALFLIPPAPALALTQKSQMLAIRENAHGNLRT